MELIRIDNDGKITARELYEFLELNVSNFSKWCKVNIIENQFAEVNKDFVRLVLNDETPTGGKIERIDYKLTIDFAKKLCMVSKTPKGEQARNYFIEVEKQFKKTDTSIQELSPQLQFLISLEIKQKEQEMALTLHNDRLEKLESIQAHKADIVNELPPVNPLTQRAQLNRIVRGYAERNELGYSKIWGNLYEQFRSRYSINLKTRAKNRNQPVLDYTQFNNYLADLLSLSIELYC